MTEKQFTIADVYDMSVNEVADLLNEQGGKIHELKQFKNNVAEVINSKMEDNVCNDYKMDVLKEIWKELNLDEVWFE